jgi:hypothetical protein
MMNRGTYRSIGALIGLALGFAIVWGMGMGGLIPLGIAGSAGSVIGGISGEQFYDQRRRS